MLGIVERASTSWLGAACSVMAFSLFVSVVRGTATGLSFRAGDDLGMRRLGSKRRTFPGVEKPKVVGVSLRARLVARSSPASSASSSLDSLRTRFSPRGEEVPTLWRVDGPDEAARGLLAALPLPFLAAGLRCGALPLVVGSWDGDRDRDERVLRVSGSGGDVERDSATCGDWDRDSWGGGV
jgi:hypothetical protein